jgi:hypothetical protein
MKCATCRGFACYTGGIALRHTAGVISRLSRAAGRRYTGVVPVIGWAISKWLLAAPFGAPPAVTAPGPCTAGPHGFFAARDPSYRALSACPPFPVQQLPSHFTPLSLSLHPTPSARPPRQHPGYAASPLSADDEGGSVSSLPLALPSRHTTAMPSRHAQPRQGRPVPHVAAAASGGRMDGPHTHTYAASASPSPDVRGDGGRCVSGGGGGPPGGRVARLR